jgi:hypothetical protein
MAVSRWNMFKQLFKKDWEQVKTEKNNIKHTFENTGGELTYSPRINPGDSNVIEVCLPE